MDADQLLQGDEGRSNHLYKDSEGFWTIGRGYCIEKLGLPDDIVDDLYRRRRDVAIADAENIFGFVFDPDNARHAAVVNMVYQLGKTGVQGFIQLRGCWERGDWVGAADAVKNSRYASQAPARAQRIATLLRTGDWASIATLV